MPEQTNQDKDAYLLTVGDVFFCIKKTKDTTTTAPIYDTKVYRKTIAKKVQVKGNGKSTPIHASGVLIGTVAMESSEEISMDHIGLPTILLDELSGLVAKNGITFTDADAHETAEFAWGFIALRSDGVTDAMWFPNCSLSPATELSYETSEDEFKEQDVSMSITANGLRIARADGKHTLFTKYSSQRDTTMTVDQFMAQPIFDEAGITAAGTPGTPVGGAQ